MRVPPVRQAIAVVALVCFASTVDASAKGPRREVMDQAIVGGLHLFTLGGYRLYKSWKLAARCDDINFHADAPRRRWYHHFVKRRQLDDLVKDVAAVIADCEAAPGCGYNDKEDKCVSMGINQFIDDMDVACGKYDENSCDLREVHRVCKWVPQPPDSSLAFVPERSGKCTVIKSGAFRLMGKKKLPTSSARSTASSTPMQHDPDLPANERSFVVRDCDANEIFKIFSEADQQRILVQKAKNEKLTAATLQQLCEADRWQNGSPIALKVKQHLHDRYIYRLLNDIYGEGPDFDDTGFQYKDRSTVFKKDMTLEQQEMFDLDPEKWRSRLFDPLEVAYLLEEEAQAAKRG